MLSLLLTAFIINPFTFSSAREMTWTFTSLTAGGSAVVQMLVNDVVVDTQSPDGSGDLTLTGSVPSGSTVKLRCTQLDNEDSVLTLYSVSSSDVTADSVVGPDTQSGGVAYPTFEWVYTNVTDGTGVTIDLSVFDAQALSNLVNNLDASALTGYSNSDLVDTWTNKTGGTDATASGTVRGVYTTGAIGGMPALLFAAGDYYTQSLSGYTGGGYTVFFVADLNSAGATHRSLFLGPSNNPYMTINGTTPKVYGFNGNILNSTHAHRLNRPSVLAMRVTPTAKELFQGRTNIISNASGNTNLAVASISGASLSWLGYIGQVLMVSDDLTDTETLQTIQMLEEKWSCRHRVVVCDGDSLTRGFAATAGYEYPTVLAAALGSDWEIRNFGVDSQTLNAMSSDAVANNDTPFATTLGTRKNVLVAWGGTNDLYYGDSAATAISDFETYCAARKAAGFKVVACTIIDRTESGGSWTAADAATFNASVRANYATYADALCDLAADPRLDDYTDSTYYQADGTHLKDAGYAAVAELVEAAVNSL